MRTMDIYHFLRFNAEGQKLIEIMPSSEETLIQLFVTPIVQKVGHSWAQRCRDIYSHWQALTIALAMGYYFRLPSAGQYNRAAFATNVNGY